MPYDPLFLYANPNWIVRAYCSDGQRYTSLIASWLREFLASFQVYDDQFSVNVVSFIKDGGVDGRIDAPGFVDPLGLLGERSVLQFKASDSQPATAATELLQEAGNGRQRIRDFVEQGFKVIWFVAKTLTDRDVAAFEAELLAAVRQIRADAIPPVVIDTNRLCAYLSKVPTVALELQGLQGVGESLRAALSNPPHDEPPFVAPENFDEFVEGLREFVRGDAPLRTFQGIPGIGKSRRVLEALSRIEECSYSTLYLRSQRELERVLGLCRTEGLRGLLVVDNYLDEDQSLPRVRKDEVPNGCKIIVIRHSFNSPRLEERGGYLDIPAMSVEDLKRVLAYYGEQRGVPEVVRNQAIALSRRNVRLAKWICENVDPSRPFSQRDFDELVSRELADADNAGVIQRLALVRVLPRPKLSQFCQLIGREPEEFLRQCGEVSQRSQFIQVNGVLLYVSIPIISQLALVRFWESERAECERIFGDPGEFARELLDRVQELPRGPAKTALLDYFALPPGPITLEMLSEPGGHGHRFLTLVTADPGRHLPLLHRAFAGSREAIKDLPYQCGNGGLDRMDILWAIRNLAQFGEFFQQCEELAYWMARDEAATPYDNTATRYWADWFRAWFAYTEFPLDQRLNILENRIREGDTRDRILAVAALTNPFPEIGSQVPRERVGGRFVPAVAHEIRRQDIDIAVERVPQLFLQLLANEDVRDQAGKVWADQMWEWLEVPQRTTEFLSVVQDESFPAEARRNVINRARSYVALGPDEDEKPNAMHRLHQEVLDTLGEPDDPLTDAEYVLKESAWDFEENEEAQRRQAQLVQSAAANPDILETLRPLLYDAESWAAGRFGVRLAERVDEDLLWQELESSFGNPYRGFVVGLLEGFLRRNPDLRLPVLELVRAREGESPEWALALYAVVDKGEYATAAARMMRQGLVSPRLFANAWVNIDLVDDAGGPDLLAAIEEQVDAGNVEAIDTALSLGRVFAHKKETRESLLRFSLKAFLAKEPVRERRGAGNRDWSGVGLWLLTYNPEAVIGGAAKGILDRYSGVIQVLAEAAKTHPAEVLVRVAACIVAREPIGSFIRGDLNILLGGIPAGVFQEWLAELDDEVKISVAGHLPRPYLGEDGTAVVPTNTRVYWNSIDQAEPNFESALREFRSNTFQTGVYFGHGLDLFSERLRVAEQLMYDTNPAIATWATRFNEESKYLLEEAERDAAVHRAHRETEAY